MLDDAEPPKQVAGQGFVATGLCEVDRQAGQRGVVQVAQVVDVGLGQGPQEPRAIRLGRVPNADQPAESGHRPARAEQVSKCSSGLVTYLGLPGQHRPRRQLVMACHLGIGGLGREHPIDVVTRATERSAPEVAHGAQGRHPPGVSGVGQLHHHGEGSVEVVARGRDLAALPPREQETLVGEQQVGAATELIGETEVGLVQRNRLVRPGEVHHRGHRIAIHLELMGSGELPGTPQRVAGLHDGTLRVFGGLPSRREPGQDPGSQCDLPLWQGVVGRLEHADEIRVDVDETEPASECQGGLRHFGGVSVRSREGEGGLRIFGAGVEPFQRDAGARSSHEDSGAPGIGGLQHLERAVAEPLRIGEGKAVERSVDRVDQCTEGLVAGFGPPRLEVVRNLEPRNR